MYKFKKLLIAFAGLLALLGAIALVTPRAGIGQAIKPPQDVRLVGTTVTQPVSASSPLPVTGSVSINDTPSVNVASMPTVNGTVGIDEFNNIVKVDTASPLAVYDLDNGRQPFQAASADTIPNGARFSQHTITTVPAGKRLVIEHVSMFAPLQPGQRLILPAIQTRVNGVAVRHYLISNALGGDGSHDNFTASQDVRFYADPGTAVEGFASRDSTAENVTYVFSISGYLISLP